VTMLFCVPLLIHVTFNNERLGSHVLECIIFVLLVSSQNLKSIQKTVILFQFIGFRLNR
jgi:hypothetical protein